jgi:hypothetical protein
VALIDARHPRFQKLCGTTIQDGDENRKTVGNLDTPTAGTPAVRGNAHRFVPSPTGTDANATPPPIRSDLLGGSAIQRFAGAARKTTLYNVF